jgi:GntR family transcriptional regulator
VKTAAPLHVRTKKYLEKTIRTLAPGNNKLESEPTLTKKLGISRGTVRKALAELYREGLISQWHGKGNYGHPTVAALPMRFDVNSNFRLLLEQSGHTVKTTRSKWVDTMGNEEMEQRIPNALNTAYIMFDQEFLADNHLAIHTTVWIDKAYLVSYPKAGIYQRNIGDFFKKHCTMKSQYVISWQKATCSKEVTSLFGLPEDTPLLEWQEAYYNILDQCMGFIKVYFNPTIMDLSMLLHFS